MDIELLSLSKCKGVAKENILAFKLGILEKQSWTEKSKKERRKQGMYFHTNQWSELDLRFRR